VRLEAWNSALLFIFCTPASLLLFSDYLHTKPLSKVTMGIPQSSTSHTSSAIISSSSGIVGSSSQNPMDVPNSKHFSGYPRTADGKE
jgi:hypothetical protein